MISEKTKELSVVEYAFYGQEQLGFALPILAVPGETSLRAIQEIDEYLNNIRAFRILNFDLLDLKTIIAPVTARIRGELIHVFVSENDQVHVGPLGTIEPALRKFVFEFPERVSIAVQIMELIGSREERHSARTKMRNCFVDNLGPLSARAFYDRSTLRSVVWRRLISAATSAEAARRLMEARPKIDAITDPMGKVFIDLSAVDPSDCAMSIADLTNDVQAEFDGFAVPAEAEDASRLDLDEIQPGNVTATVYRVKSAGIKEERMAMLLDALIQHPKDTAAILRKYGRDRSVYANRVLERILLPTFLLLSPSGTDNIEFTVAKLIPKLYTASFTMDRGIIMYFLAKHLGKYRHINEAIHARVAKSRSGIVKLYVSEIEEFLSKRSTSVRQ